MKENVVYNKPHNTVMVRTNGDEIFVVCEKEEFVIVGTPMLSGARTR